MLSQGNKAPDVAQIGEEILASTTVMKRRSAVNFIPGKTKGGNIGERRAREGEEGERVSSHLQNR